MSVQSKKIALFFATSGHSGVDTVVKNLIEEFSKQSVHFDLLRIHNHGPHIETLPENVRDIRFPVKHKLTALPFLAHYLITEKPDVVLTANHSLNRLTLLARLLVFSQSKVVIRMGMSIEGKTGEMPKKRRQKTIASMKFWYRFADSVIVPSLGLGVEMKKLVQIDETKLHVINNPVVTEKLKKLSLQSIDEVWLKQKKYPLILAVGSLEKRKDFTTLIKAFAMLLSQKQARLIILGEGKERSNLTQLVEKLGVAEQVKLPGFRQNPYAYMKKADLFVLSSLREGSGAVLVEALACGTPVVSTACPVGPDEILQQGKLGKLVSTGDIKGLSEAMLETLLNPLPEQQLLEGAEAFRSDLSARQYLKALGAH